MSRSSVSGRGLLTRYHDGGERPFQLRQLSPAAEAPDQRKHRQHKQLACRTRSNWNDIAPIGDSSRNFLICRRLEIKWSEGRGDIIERNYILDKPSSHSVRWRTDRQSSFLRLI